MYGKRTAITLMLVLTPSAALAETARSCMTPVEAEALIQYALPDIIDHLGKACTIKLPATSYLIRSRVDLVDRYTQAATPALPIARVAFGKVAGIKAEQVENLRDETLRGLLSMGIGTAIDGKFKPKDCGMIDQILELLAPLPPENMAKLIGIALREGDKPKQDDTGKSSPLRLCTGKQGA